MATELPDEVDCRQIVADSGTLAGTIAAARLRRIEAPYRVTDQVHVRLALRAHEQGGFAVNGNLSVALAAQCQRCLEWMRLPLEVTVAVVALSEADAARMADDDWVLLADDKLKLRELVEDELLLSCPLAPRHATAGCNAGTDRSDADARRQPFAALAELLKRQE